MAKPECLWVKCIGEAHAPSVAGNMDHCGVCMPWWEWYPVCRACGKRLTETTPSHWPLENRESPHRLWCRTCRKHVRWTPPPIIGAVVSDADLRAKEETVPITPRRSTDLARLKQGEAFTWGQVVAIHEVGPYAVVEHHPWKSVDRRVLVGQPDPDALDFHAYVDGRDCSHSFGTLDAALAGCIAYRIEGPNHHADAYFIRSLADWPPTR